MRLEPTRPLGNAESVSRRPLNATVVIGALALCACSVYGPDLIGSDGTFGDGGRSSGGVSGAGVSGGSAPRGGTGAGGILSGGSGGKSSFGGASPEGGSNATGGNGKGTTGGSAPTTGGKGSVTGGEGGEETGGSTASGGMGGSVNTGGGSSGGTTGGSKSTTGGEATGGMTPVVTELIDDMEDGDQTISFINTEAGLRNGAWYTASGKGGEATPEPMKSFVMPEIEGTPGVDGSTRAMHFIAKGGTEWGAMTAFDFKAPAAGAKVPYDASAYKGITFWAKAAAASQIVVRIPMKDTTSGVCATDGCDNHFAFKVSLTTSWKKFSLPWSPTASNVFFQDPAWGYQTTFKSAQLLSVQFVVLLNTSADFWIDDISFIP